MNLLRILVIRSYLWVIIRIFKKCHIVITVTILLLTRSQIRLLSGYCWNIIG